MWTNIIDFSIEIEMCFQYSFYAKKYLMWYSCEDINSGYIHCLMNVVNSFIYSLILMEWPKQRDACMLYRVRGILHFPSRLLQPRLIGENCILPACVRVNRTIYTVFQLIVVNSKVITAREHPLSDRYTYFWKYSKYSFRN